ncbi:MAG: polysaccharide deacetylase family protein [Saprospiraceae bacterium]|nr:polysaccharide deacetylase family protein [Saprospiraceae bacterium]
MYPVKTPKFVQSLFPTFTWNVPSSEKVLYLTFDDGPIPEVTPWVLKELAQHHAQATFFCVGENAKKYPTIFEELHQAGHGVGNHTYNHLDGWRTDNIKYFHNIRHCRSLVKSNLFRPPYGHLKPKQAQFLQRHYHVVMWDVLSGDFDLKLTKEKCFENVVRYATNGSIIVFHDSQKAKERLMYALPRTLEHFSLLGFTFSALKPSL